MDFLDYREKLKIGFSDSEKAPFFFNKVFNFIDNIQNDVYSGCIDFREYCDFCNTAGLRMLQLNSAQYSNSNRFTHVAKVLSEHTDNIADLLSYYMALTNSVKVQKHGTWNRAKFVQLIEQMLTQSHIQYEIVQNEDEFFIFPKGIPEFDQALVSEPLNWLSSYPMAHVAWVKALKEYSALTDDNASDIADKFRKALESFFHEFFNTQKSLENCKSLYGDYLKNAGVPKEISKNFETLLSSYTDFMNGYAKHQDRTSKNVLEYLMYQTGNIIRLLITLKQEAEANAD